MKKLYLPFSSILLAGTVGLSAMNLDDFQIVSEHTFVTDYIFRGVKEAGPSAQTALEVSAYDAYLGTWANFPIEQADGDNEVNFYAGYEYPIPGVENVVLDGGLTVYWYPDGADTADDRTHEWFIGANISEFGVYGMTFGSYLRKDFDLKTTTFQPYVGYTVDLAEWGIPNTSIDTEAYAGFISGRKGSESYNFYGFSVAIPYDVNEVVGVEVGLAYEDNSGTSEKGNHLFGQASISLGF